MAVFTVAVAGEAKNKANFEIARKNLEQSKSNPEDVIRFVDISELTQAQILSLGPVQAILYEKGMDQAKYDNVGFMLKTAEKNSNSLQVFALSHEQMTEHEQAEENNVIKSYLSKDSKVSVFPVNVNTEKEMNDITNGYLHLSAESYFALANPEEEQQKRLVKLFEQIVENALDGKHDYTAGHVDRVSRYAEKLAAEMVGQKIGEYEVTEADVAGVALSARLHDIGKIGIPDEVLGKKDILNNVERGQMDYHSSMGAGILQAVANSNPELAKILTEDVIKGVGYHHKDWDGYRNNGDRFAKAENKKDDIREGKIGPYATIIAVADCIDAMTSQRAYNNPKHVLDTFRDLWANKGTQFNPTVAEAAIVMIGKELASLGIDPTKLVPDNSDRKGSRNDPDLKKFLEDHKNDFEVAKDVPEGTFSSLGFRVNKYGYFEFEGKHIPVLDRKIGYKDEYKFQLGLVAKANGKTVDELTPEERKEAEKNTNDVFEKQDNEGLESIAHARSNERTTEKNGLGSQILEAALEDSIGFSQSNNNQATITVKSNYQEQIMAKENPEAVKNVGMDK